MKYKIYFIIIIIGFISWVAAPSAFATEIVNYNSTSTIVRGSINFSDVQMGVGYAVNPVSVGDTLNWQLNGYDGSTCTTVGKLYLDTFTATTTMTDIFNNTPSYHHIAGPMPLAGDGGLPGLSTSNQYPTGTVSSSITIAAGDLVVAHFYCVGTGVNPGLGNDGSGSNHIGDANSTSWIDTHASMQLFANSPVVPPGNQSAEASLIVPSSTYVGPDFSNWVVNFYPATTTLHTYYLQMQYYNDSAPIAGSTTAAYIYRDYSSIVTNATTTWAFPKLNNLFGYQNSGEATTTWNAALYISNDLITWTQTDFSSFIITPHATSTGLGTSTIFFSDGTTSTEPINNLAGPFYWNPVQIFTGATNYPQTSASSSAYLASQCTPAADWTDIGGGLNYAFCSFSNYLFIPSNNSISYIQSGIDRIKLAFPFNLVYGTIGNMVDAATTAQTETASTTLLLPVFDGEIPIVSSSSLESFVGMSNKNLIFQVEGAAAWVGVAWTILKIIF